ncbi:MAG: helix-turn-helix domain-containing protein [Gammaproteobacteria bacterium]
MHPGLQGCPVEDALRILSGKWRLLVLFRLGEGPQRFNALQRLLAPVTQKVLTTTLRGLEAEGLIWRKSANTIPPQVTYGLSARGAALAPVFDALGRWRLDGAVQPEGVPEAWGRRCAS